jgi:hypothetical protein
MGAGTAEHSFMAIMEITRGARFKRGCMAGQNKIERLKVKGQFIFD